MPFINKLKCLLLFTFAVQFAKAQPCADNINFYTNSFKNWDCSTGSIDRSGVITFDGFVPVTGRQTLIPNTSTAIDPYGQFPVVSPNGSKYTLRLGNSSSNHEAEQVSYTYTIPTDQPNYTVTYYYAVVLQLTNHLEFERPRFSVKLTDINNNEVVACGTHDFVSGDGLGDFKQSTNGQVEYRDWSTVAINLAGRQGHKLRFDFTTNDCVYNVHFGYAYLAFDDPCQQAEPISGSAYCRGANTVTLTAPPGFGQYNWHLDGKSEILGTEQKLLLKTVPADGTKYVVDVLSSSGVGQNCPASFNAVVKKVDEDFIFNLVPSAKACASDGINLKDPLITAGSSSDMTFKYYVDANAQVVIRDPTLVTKTDTYFIQGTNKYGCTDIKSIKLILIPSPAVTAVMPKAVCSPATVDLTDQTIVGGYIATLNYEYFTDKLMTIRAINPAKISVSGLYYIKITNTDGCNTQVPVNISINSIPFIKAQAVSGCAPFNLTSIDKSGDSPGLTYTYFTDAAATIPFKNPDIITQSGIIYAVGTTSSCSTPAATPIQVTINPPASIDLPSRAEVRYPTTVDLSRSFTNLPGYKYEYYTDSLATVVLPNYQKIDTSGTYFIKAINSTGCEIIQAIQVTVNPPFNAGITVKNTFTPNADGINDEFTPTLVGAAQIRYFKIYNRNGTLVYDTKDIGIYWKGTVNGSPVPVGTYYWVFSCYDTFYKQDVIQSGSVTIIR